MAASMPSACSWVWEPAEASASRRFSIRSSLDAFRASGAALFCAYTGFRRRGGDRESHQHQNSSAGAPKFLDKVPPLVISFRMVSSYPVFMSFSWQYKGKFIVFLHISAIIAWHTEEKAVICTRRKRGQKVQKAPNSRGVMSQRVFTHRPPI